MDDINYEPDCTQLFDQATVLIWHAIEESKKMHRDGKGSGYTERQILLMGVEAGARVVQMMASAELDIIDQLNEILNKKP